MIKYSFESRFYQACCGQACCGQACCGHRFLWHPKVRGSGPPPNGQKSVEKHKKWSDLDARPAFRAFPGAKLIAGGPGTFWTEGNPKKTRKTQKSMVFGSRGSTRGSHPLSVPLKGYTGGRYPGPEFIHHLPTPDPDSPDLKILIH